MGKRIIHSGVLRSIACLFLFVFIGTGSAKSDTGKSILQSLEKHFLVMDTLVLGQHSSAGATYEAIPQSYFDNLNSYTANVDEALKGLTKARVAELKSETGLELAGQAYVRPEDAFMDDDGDAVSRYNGKVQAEVKWNFFNSSWYKRKGRIEEINIKEDIERQRYRQEDLGLLVVKQKELFRRSYDKALGGVLIHHIKTLALLSEAQEYLLQNEDISSDKLMTILNEKAEAERLFATTAMSPDSPGASDLSNPQGVVTLLDTIALYEKIRSTQYDMALLDLRMQLLERQAKNTSYFSTMTLAPFVRYSYYFRKVLDNSGNLDVGLSFRFPLSLETAKKRKALRAEKALLDAERDRVEDKVLERARLIVAEVARLNRSTTGELERLRKQKAYIAMRVDAYNNRLGHYDMMARAKEYNKYFECWERLLAFQYQRDCLIADLQALLNETSVLEYCREVEM